MFTRRGHLQGGYAALFSPIVWECKDGYLSYFFLGGQPGARANQKIVEWMDSKGMAPKKLKEMDWENLDMGKMSQDELDTILEPMANFFKTCTKAEVREESVKGQIMLYPVSDSKETLENPQLEARDFWINIHHDELNDTVTYPGSFAKFSETPIKQPRRAPLIGEHNEEIYIKELGLSQEEMITLKGAGVI